MISFKEIESEYSLGNNLFQYAFIRTLAKRLKTKFYFPSWKGDEIFDLEDQKKRIKSKPEIKREYNEPNNDLDVPKQIKEIKDGAEIGGYFQSEDFFDKKEVRRWFRFKESIIKRAKKKYRNVDFSESVGLHLRFSDTKTLAPYYVPNLDYYKEGLFRIKQKENIFVFSDEVKLAKEYLKSLKGNFIYVEGNNAAEDLYLMSQCKNFICSASTLCWWGAWLNSNEDKRIIAPREGSLRPGYKKFKRNYFFPKEWIRIRALRRGIRDNYYFVYLKYLPKNIPNKFYRGLKLLLGKKNESIWKEYVKK